MAGRESRRQLLAPSFIVMATALACGGTSVSNGEKERGGPTMNPPSAGEAGSGGGLVGVGGYGGSANLPFVVGGSAGTTSSPGVVGGAAGAGANPPATFVCPSSSALVLGQSCTGTGQCPSMLCGSLTTISCTGGKWTLPVTPAGCNPPALACPVAVPVHGTRCAEGNGFPNHCSYPTPECSSRWATCSIGTWLVYDCATGEAGAAGQSAVGGQGGEGGAE